MSTDRAAMIALLDHWVTATSPHTQAVWQGRLVGIADHPTVILQTPGGGQVSLPQTVDLQPASPPEAPTSGGRPRPFAELRDTGLLWLINRLALHPRSLALALHTDETGNVLGWSLLVSDDGDPWVFDLATDADGHARAEATIAAALDPDSVPDTGHARGGIVRTCSVGEDNQDDGPLPTSADSVRTGHDDGPADNSGVRVEYRARVPRHLLGAAIAEAAHAINTARTPPAKDSRS
jgi:hypothetical protein